MVAAMVMVMVHIQGPIQVFLRSSLTTFKAHFSERKLVWDGIMWRVESPKLSHIVMEKLAQLLVDLSTSMPIHLRESPG